MKRLPFFLALTTLIFFLNVSPLLAQEETILIPENSLFCTDFRMTYEKSEEGPTQETQGSESCEPDEGEISLEDKLTKQPDFSTMNNRLQLTMPKLMPLPLNEKVEITSNGESIEPIETRAKHFIVPDEGAACAYNVNTMNSEEIPVSEEEIPETKFLLPLWWTELLGQTKIFCGLFSASERCLPPENLKIKIESPNPEEISENIDLYASEESPISPKEGYLVCDNLGQKVKDTEPSLSILKNIFNFSPKVKKSIFTKLVGTVEQFFMKTEKFAPLENKTRGVLVGGHTLGNQSEFFSNFIIHEINSGMDNGPVAGNAAYNLAEDFVINPEDQESAEKENYQEQDKVRIRNCLQLCSLYPPDSKFDVSTFDPICISCNPKDYEEE